MLKSVSALWHFCLCTVDMQIVQASSSTKVPFGQCTGEPECLLQALSGWSQCTYWRSLAGSEDF